MELNNDAVSAATESAVSETPPTEVSTPSDAGTGTARDSIDRAFAALDTPEGGDTSKPEGDARKRDAQGKFAAGDTPEAAQAAEAAPVTPEAPKPASPLDEPPARFSADAKAAWATLPEAVRGETKRAFTEMEQGLQRYQETVAPLKPFLDMAAQHNTTLPQALSNYIGIENLLKQDLPSGLAKICENMGTSLRDVAAQILGQAPDAQASQSDATIRELRQHIGRLEQQVGGVTSTIQQQQDAQLAQQVQAFAAERPRFEELKPTMAQLLQSGMASDLSDAYEMANRLNPGSVPPAMQSAPTAAPAAKPDLTAQTRKGQLSITGAPSSGSNPINRKPPSSASEAINRAFAQVGIT